MSGAGHDEDECEIGPGAGHQPEESADVETAKVDRSAGLLFVLKAAGYEKAAEDEEDRNSMLTDAICVGDMQSDVESNYDVAHQNQEDRDCAPSVKGRDTLLIRSNGDHRLVSRVDRPRCEDKRIDRDTPMPPLGEMTRVDRTRPVRVPLC